MLIGSPSIQLEHAGCLGAGLGAPAFERNRSAPARCHPDRGTKRRKRKKARGIVVRGDEGALALRRTSRFSAAISSMALRTVPWLTLKRVASSDSLGMASPYVLYKLKT
jgi:hypothetical protein